MAISERAGRPADPASSSTSTGSSAPTTTSGPTRPTRPSASRSAPPATAARRSTAPSTRRTSRRPPRRSAATARRRAPTGRCSSGATRTRCPSRRSRRRCGVLAAHGVDVRIDAADGYTPTPVDLARDPRPQPGRRPRAPPGRRDRRHAVAQPARGRRLQVQPAQRRPGRHGRHGLDPGRGEPPARGAAWPASAGSPLADARAAATTPHDFLGDATSATSPSVIDMDAIRASGLRLGVDPLGGASVAYWPAIGERYGLDLTVTNDDGRPAVRVHDLRLGRPDPDGPVVAVRDGPPGRAARPVRRRVRQRHRRRPPRDRHAGRRACSTRTTSWRSRSATCSAAAATGAPTSPSARPSSRAR